MKKKVLCFTGFAFNRENPIVGMKKVALPPSGDSKEGCAARIFCKCDGRDVPKRSAGRAHYHCLFADCPYVADREARIRAHEQTHEKEYVKCYCSSINNWRYQRGGSHYHCDICNRHFARVCRLRQHKDNAHATPKVSGELHMSGFPRVGNPFEWFPQRLVKEDILPTGMSSSALEEVRSALRISKAVIPDLRMIRNRKWADIFRVETFGQEVGRRVKESCALILDSFPRIWIFRSVPRCEMVDIIRARQTLYIQKIGYVSLGFVLLLRATYSNCLCFKGSRRSVMLSWAVRIDAERIKCPELPDSYFNWAAAAVPSTQCIQIILQKTHHLFDGNASALTRAVILLDSHVIRADGHFKAPKRILTGVRRERGKCFIAFLGCAGFLLQELRLCKSESGDAYLSGMRDVLSVRAGAGLPPPHIIVDNPSLIEGRIQSLVKSIWGNSHTEFFLAGDPIHRKIELKEKLDKTHQDTPDAEHDYSYCLMRFGFLLPESICGQTADAENRLGSTTESLFKGRYDLRGDPYSSESLHNSREWRKNPTAACYIKTFTRQHRARLPGKAIDISPKFATLLRRYFEGGSIKGEFPDALNALLLDYWESPFALDGYYLPSGAVRRAIRASLRHEVGGKGAAKFPVVAEPFPAYTTFEEYEADIARFVLWYNRPIRSLGRHRKPAPQRDDMCFGGETTHNRYPRKNQSVLTQPVLQVIANGMLRLNSVYYFRHAQVANSVRQRDFFGSMSISEEGSASSIFEVGPE